MRDEVPVALVGDDTVYGRPSGQFNGKEEIREFVEDLWLGRSISNFWVSARSKVSR
jgi:hypothetical protein